MPSKEPLNISLKEFAELSDAPEGRGRTPKRINWDAVFEAVNTVPMTNAQVYSMIISNKDKYMFDEKDEDPHKGTVWTKLNGWAKDEELRKAVDKKGNIYYGPIPA